MVSVEKQYGGSPKQTKQNNNRKIKVACDLAILLLVIYPKVLNTAAMFTKALFITG
jgi:hypothetical protein